MNYVKQCTKSIIDIPAQGNSESSPQGVGKCCLMASLMQIYLVLLLIFAAMLSLRSVSRRSSFLLGLQQMILRKTSLIWVMKDEG